MTRANLLLIREVNVNGDGDFADVMIQLEYPPGGADQAQANSG